MSFARVWTGFDFQAMRGNIEHSGHVQNQVDPLQIIAAWRDTFPKTDLNGNFLGDSYPLCSDLLSERPFLRLGAKYVLLGSKSGLPSSFDDIDARPRMAPNETGSELYSALCDAAASGSCQFPTEVTKPPEKANCVRIHLPLSFGAGELNGCRWVRGVEEKTRSNT